LARKTGRTTFVNTLCGKKVLEHKDADDAANAHIEEGVRIKPVTVGMSMNKISSLQIHREAVN
jgi:cell division control protein 11